MLTPTLPTEATTGLPLSARRRMQAGFVATSAAGVPRTGVLATEGTLLVTGTSDQAMTYRVGQFVGASSRDGVGVEFTANDSSEAVPAGAVAPSANSRIDVIWFRARFPSLTDAGQTAPQFGVTRGVADANPQKPSLPAGAEELATAVVTSSDLTTQTVQITQTARLTAFAGGTVPLRNQAEQNSWNPADGALAVRLDTGALLQRIAGAWVSIRRRQGNQVEALAGASGAVADANTSTPVINFSLPEEAPVGALLHIHADLEIFAPAVAAEANYAGYLQLIRVETNSVLAQRRWHTNGRTGRNIYPSVELNRALASTIPAGAQFRFAIVNDPNSAGGVELRNAFLSWGVS